MPIKNISSNYFIKTMTMTMNCNKSKCFGKVDSVHIYKLIIRFRIVCFVVFGGWGEGGLSSPECERSGLQGEARGEGQSPGNLRWDAAGGQKGMCDLQLEHFP